MKKLMVMTMALLAALAWSAENARPAQPVVHIVGNAAEKMTVSVNVGGPNGAAYASCLKRNLELSGCFIVRDGGRVRVTGSVGAVVAVGNGKQLTDTAGAADALAARMAARRMADAMCQSFAGQKGFAQSRIAFVNRKGRDNSELYTCYADGQDIRQITADGKAVVGPRWKNADTLYYTGFINRGPQVFEVNANTSRKRLAWNFKGLTTGAAVSPDGRKVAMILSFQGNPELYVIDIASGNWERLTKTPGASEGQPSWSPDGKSIVYVSDETRHPQLYIINVATRAKRRLTSKGTQNIDPDWGRDGRIAYVTKRNGTHQIAVLNPAEGEAMATTVTPAGTWENPSWAKDGRHLVVARDRALFIVDTAENGDKPVQIFYNKGNWMDPVWSR